MAYRKKRYYRSKTKHGRVFRTKRGRIGCYVYKNGKRVGFVSKRRRY